MSIGHGAVPDGASGFRTGPMIGESLPTATTTARVIVVDDNFVMRAGIRALLEGANIEVLAEAGDASAALEHIRRLQPEVVIVDPRVSGNAGTSFISSVGQQAPRAKVLVLSDVAGADAIRAAFDAGASGYVAKNDDLVDLPGVLRTIVSGQTYVSQRISQNLLESYAAEDGRPSLRRANLTQRQTEILKLIAQGETTRTISKNLGITPRTVHTHRSRIMQKLDVHTEGALVYSAFKLGLVSV